MDGLYALAGPAAGEEGRLQGGYDKVQMSCD